LNLAAIRLPPDRFDRRWRQAPGFALERLKIPLGESVGRTETFWLPARQIEKSGIKSGYICFYFTKNAEFFDSRGQFLENFCVLAA